MLADAMGVGNIVEVPLRRQKLPKARANGRRPTSATMSTARSALRPPAAPAAQARQGWKPGKAL